MHRKVFSERPAATPIFVKPFSRMDLRRKSRFTGIIYWQKAAAFSELWALRGSSRAGIAIAVPVAQSRPTRHFGTITEASWLFWDFLFSGFIIGLIARALKPGNDNMGLIATTLLESRALSSPAT